MYSFQMKMVVFLLLLLAAGSVSAGVIISPVIRGGLSKVYADQDGDGYQDRYVTFELLDATDLTGHACAVHPRHFSIKYSSFVDIDTNGDGVLDSVEERVEPSGQAAMQLLNTALGQNLRVEIGYSDTLCGAQGNIALGTNVLLRGKIY